MKYKIYLNPNIKTDTEVNSKFSDKKLKNAHLKNLKNWKIHIA